MAHVTRASFTFCVAAGLCEGVAVSQHGCVGHRDPHGASLLAGFILRNRHTHRQKNILDIKEMTRRKHTFTQNIAF